jgi:ElaB/YqjD/DUF883 family membrane-anchored ribosome-binding protein
MTTANDHLKSIQARIDELEHTISERGEQIRNRTSQIKEELKDELSPEELIRKHPFEAVGGALFTGLVVGKAIRSLFGGRSRKRLPEPSVRTEEVHHSGKQLPVAVKAALATVGAEALHAGQDLAVSWLRNYIEEKKKKPA